MRSSAYYWGSLHYGVYEGLPLKGTPMLAEMVYSESLTTASPIFQFFMVGHCRVSLLALED